MRKLSYIGIVILSIFFWSCEDFLNYKENDKMIPETIENYSELLLGEVIRDGQSTDEMEFVCMMTDDVSEYQDTRYALGKDRRLKYLHYYRWALDLEKDEEGKYKQIKAWEDYYHKILMCNIIIKEINELEDIEKNSNEKYLLEGECHFMRANSYFNLVNLYGEIYESFEQSKEAKGIPINKEIGVADILYDRSTLRQNYDLIEQDLKKSIEIFKNHEREINTIFRPNIDAAYILLSRIYLYQKEYQKVISTVNQMLDQTSFSIFDLAFWKEKYFLTKSNTGTVFSFDAMNYPTSFSNAGARFIFRASEDLMNLFSTNDIRKEAFFTFSNSYNYPSKCEKSQRSIKGKNLRIEEAYLNRAEAYAELGKIEEAIKDINEIRKNKIKGDYQVSATNKEEAINLVRTERRIELSFELHRWYDLRRYGCPEIKHLYTNSNGQTSKYYILEKNSPNYTLEAPFELLNLNTSLKNANRIEVKVEEN